MARRRMKKMLGIGPAVGGLVRIPFGRLALAVGVSVLLVLGAAPSALAATNVVPNPGFEQGGCGASTPIICGWSGYGMTQVGSPGNYSMLLECPPTGCYGSVYGTSLSAQTDPAFCAAIGPGPHPASFTATTSGDSVYFRAGFYQGPDCTGLLGSDAIGADASNAGQVTGVLVAPAGTQSALFEVGVTTTADCSDYCWFDATFDDVDVEDTVLPDPAITSRAPAGGMVGTSVDIQGWNFTGATSVAFNGTPANFTVDSNSEIHATVPEGATTGPISVTTPNGTTSGYSFTVATTPEPVISNFTPGEAPAGTSVDIVGWNFTGATSVAFNGTPANFTVDSDSEIHATAPGGATGGPISVTTPNGTATSCCFAFSPPPSELYFTPTSGPAGTSVTIQGGYLFGTTAVTFNGAAASFTYSSGTITATVPNGATSGPISVTTPSGTGTSSSSFTVTSPPTISSFMPTSGAVGASVDIQGAGLSGATSVTFNGTAASYTVNGSTEITAHVPTGASTGPISVTTPVGTATSSSSFTVTPPPSISIFTPPSGPSGTSVDIQGAGFTGATSVKFNGSTAAYTVDSDFEITAQVPTGATTGPISVATPGGTATSTSSFTVTSPPMINSFTPTSGPAGTSVSITGTSFTGATSVKFNGTAASYTINSPTSITANVPSSATSGPISVTTPYGTVTSAGSFTVNPAPSITGFTPTQGPPGKKVTISGINFVGVSNIKLGTIATAYTVNSPTQITATVPNIAHGNYKWSVTTPGGGASSTNYFHVP